MKSRETMQNSNPFHFLRVCVTLEAFSLHFSLFLWEHFLPIMSTLFCAKVDASSSFKNDVNQFQKKGTAKIMLIIESSVLKVQCIQES